MKPSRARVISIVLTHVIAGGAIAIGVAWYVALRGAEPSPWSFDVVAVEGRQISGAPIDWGVPRWAAEGGDLVYRELRIGFSSLPDRRLPLSRQRSFGWPLPAVAAVDHFIEPRLGVRPAADFSWEMGFPIPDWATHSGLVTRKETTHLPIQPLWMGLALNSVVFALMLSGFSLVAGRIRGRFRLRRGVCPSCAYPIGTSPNCTECGQELPRTKIPLRMPEGTAAASSPSGTSPAEQQTDQGVA